MVPNRLKTRGNTATTAVLVGVILSCVALFGRFESQPIDQIEFGPRMGPSRTPHQEVARVVEGEGDPAVGLNSEACRLLSKMPEENLITLKRVLESAQKGSLDCFRSIDPTELDALADQITTVLPRDALAALIETYLHLPREIFLMHPDSKQALLALADIVAERKLVKSQPCPLVITDSCDPDGRIVGDTSVLPYGTRRVYGVFEGTPQLDGLTHVIAAWRAQDGETMSYMEAEPIQAARAYNYVWYELSDVPVPSGVYRLDIYKPLSREVIASSTFRIQ